MCQPEIEPSKLQLARERLVTPDDPFHIHKTLGLAALVSFAFRLMYIGDKMGFVRYPSLTIPTVLLHAALQMSSFEFHLPKRRISYGGRLWPQARMHSAIFVGRSLLTMLLYWIEDIYQLEPKYMANYVIIVCSMALADVGTWSVGANKSNTIRDLKAPLAFKYFFSVAQFYATARLLFGARTLSVPFTSVILIQIGAFMATLRRKNLVQHDENVVGYVGALLFVSMVSTIDHYNIGGGMASTVAPRGAIFLIGNTAAYWRMIVPSVLRPRLSRVTPIICNKYFIWSVMALLLDRIIRPILNKSEFSVLSEKQLEVLAAMSAVPILVHGYSLLATHTTDATNLVSVGNREKNR
jgi:hypothetical protein